MLIYLPIVILQQLPSPFAQSLGKQVEWLHPPMLDCSHDELASPCCASNWKKQDCSDSNSQPYEPEESHSKHSCDRAYLGRCILGGVEKQKLVVVGKLVWACVTWHGFGFFCCFGMLVTRRVGTLTFGMEMVVCCVESKPLSKLLGLTKGAF